jgi:hypothetical protein
MLSLFVKHVLLLELESIVLVQKLEFWHDTKSTTITQQMALVIIEWYQLHVIPFFKRSMD